MPDDSDLTHQIKQRAHGDRIRAERAMMDLTGRSRSEIREWMHAETTRIQDDQVSQLRRGEVPDFKPTKVTESRTQSNHGFLTASQVPVSANAGAKSAGDPGAPTQIVVAVWPGPVNKLLTVGALALDDIP